MHAITKRDAEGVGEEEGGGNVLRGIRACDARARGKSTSNSRNETALREKSPERSRKIACDSS